MSARRCLAALLTALALVALSLPLWAREVCVPFKAIGTTTYESAPVPGPGPDQMTLELAGGGHATHLGDMTSTATVVLTFAEVPGVGYVPVFFEGDLTLVGANGDRLYVTTFGVADEAGGAGQYEIVGGTGRFAGATGSGCFTKTGGTGVFDGNIRLVHGK